MTDITTVIDRVKGCVVVIRSAVGSGSGFIIDPRGLVATNRHVVEDSERVVVELADETQLSARVVRAYQSPDLAFVLLTTADRDLPSLTLAAPSTIRPGMEIYAIGHPGIGDVELPYAVSRGIVSGVARPVRGATYIQTDVAMNPGNSGGPIIDPHGQVVGMSTWGFHDAQNLNFAVPGDVIRAASQSLLDQFDTLHTRRLCVVCGESNAATAAYCLRCGQSFSRLPTEAVLRPHNSSEPRSTPPPVACAVCGSPPASGAAYCPVCGAGYRRQASREDP